MIGIDFVIAAIEVQDDYVNNQDEILSLRDLVWALCAYVRGRGTVKQVKSLVSRALPCHLAEWLWTDNLKCVWWLNPLICNVGMIIAPVLVVVDLSELMCTKYIK